MGNTTTVKHDTNIPIKNPLVLEKNDEINVTDIKEYSKNDNDLDEDYIANDEDDIKNCEDNDIKNDEDIKEYSEINLLTNCRICGIECNEFVITIRNGQLYLTCDKCSKTYKCHGHVINGMHQVDYVGNGYNIYVMLRSIFNDKIKYV